MTRWARAETVPGSNFVCKRIGIALNTAAARHDNGWPVVELPCSMTFFFCFFLVQSGSGELLLETVTALRVALMLRTQASNN